MYKILSLFILIIIPYIGMSQSQSPPFTKIRGDEIEGRTSNGLKLWAQDNNKQLFVNDTSFINWLNQRILEYIENNEIEVDTSLFVKRSGITQLSPDEEADIRIGSGSSNFVIENNNNYGLHVFNTYTRLGKDGFGEGLRSKIDVEPGSIDIVTDSVELRMFIGGTAIDDNTRTLSIHDNRNNGTTNRRHGLKIIGPPSSAIRATPDAVIRQRDLHSILDSASFMSFTDTSFLIATKADISGISGDYWPLSGNFSTSGNQTVNFGGLTEFINNVGGINLTLNSSSTGNISITNNGSTGNNTTIARQNGSGNLIIRSSGSNSGDIVISKQSTSGTGGDIIIQHTSTGDGNIDITKSDNSDGDINITNERSTGNITINNSGIRTDSSAVNENRLKTYVAEAIDTLGSGEIGPFTANRVIISDGSGNLSTSNTTTTQLGFLDATSSIQTQLNNKMGLSGNQAISSSFGLTSSGISRFSISSTETRIIANNTTEAYSVGVSTSGENAYITRSSAQSNEYINLDFRYGGAVTTAARIRVNDTDNEIYFTDSSNELNNINIASPSANTHAATKSYVDSLRYADISKHSTNVTVAQTDTGKTFEFDDLATITFPDGLQAGSHFSIVNIGVDPITITADTGLTLNGTLEDSITLTEQYKAVYIYYSTTSTIIAIGAYE